MNDRPHIRNIPLREAQAFAGAVVRALRPLCKRIAVAGSVRRQCVAVHDIDIVCLPHSRDELLARATERAELLQDGEQNVRLLARNGITVELYLAHDGIPDLLGDLPSNWASLLVCRTGSKEHNTRLALAAKANGMRWRPYLGVYDTTGRLLETRTERAVFEAIGVDYKRPRERV